MTYFDKKQRQTIFLALALIVMALCALIAATGCGAAEEQTTQTEELGALEQEYSAWFAANSAQTEYYTYGACQHYTRQKCQRNSQCPGNSACIVPRTSVVKVRLDGFDPYENEDGVSWKYEVRRVLDVAGWDPFNWRIEEDGPSAMAWTFSEVTDSTARVVIRNNTAGWPCPEGAGVHVGCANKLTNFVRVIEPSNLTTMTESPLNFPGTYKTPATYAAVRTIEINLQGLENYVRSWFCCGGDVNCGTGYPPSFLSECGAANDLPFHHPQGAFHFVLEHFARWAILNMMGIGTIPSASGFGGHAAKDIGSPFDGGNDEHAPTSNYLWRHGISGYDDSWNYNTDNWVRQWESCQLRNAYVYDSNETNFWEAPAGCTIP